MPIIPQNRQPNQVGSGFTNLNRYLQANKANRLGATVAGGIQQAGQAAAGALNQAGQQFQQGAQAEKQRLGEQGQFVSNTLGGDVSKVGESDVNRFQNILGAESKGPTGIQNANELRSKAESAQNLGKAGGSEQGRFGLLQKFVGQGRPYQLGQQRLDQTLLGQTGQQQLRQASAANRGLVNNVNQQVTAAQAQGQELQGQAKQLAESAKGQLGQSITNYDQAMAQKLADQQAAIQGNIAKFGSQENAALEFDQDTLDKLAAATNGQLKEGVNIYGADLSPYLKVNSLYATKQAAQSAEDLARAQALSKLGGQYIAPEASGQLIQQYTADPSLVGQLQANPFEVTSLNELAGKVSSQQQGYNADTAAQREIINNILGVGMGSTQNRWGTIQGNSSQLQDRLRDLYAESQGIQADAQTRGDKVGLEDALNWAKGVQAVHPNDYVYNQGEDVSPDQRAVNAHSILDQIQKNNEALADRQKELARMEDKYKTFRVLKKKA